MESNAPHKVVETYTVRKDKIMKNVIDNELHNIRRALDKLQSKYLNNTRIFPTDEYYLLFCRTQVTAAILKHVSIELEQSSL